jgi:ankyrin repeat protein
MTVNQDLLIKLYENCRYGHLDVVKFLIERGANIHADNDRALRWAVIKEQYEIVMYLRKAAGERWKCNTCLVRATCMELCEDFRK